jgi:hypothetical protein
MFSKFDGLVKSPSVPLGAGLRFKFGVAVNLGSPLPSSVLALMVPPWRERFLQDHYALL